MDQGKHTIIDVTAHQEGDRIVFEADDLTPPTPTWKQKLKLYLFLATGLALGVVLFLAFLTVFVYVVLPLAVLGAVWMGLRRMFAPRA